MKSEYPNCEKLIVKKNLGFALIIFLVVPLPATARIIRLREKTNNEASLSVNLSNNITEGLYWLGNTGQGLEVKGNRYRYYDENGSKQWKPISELKRLRNGVIYDGKSYWCLSTLVPENKPGVCSANGWMTEKAKLPFVGTKFFNFLGGSGTGQSITIKKDGATIVKTHGVFNSSVVYKGKFSNPIIFKDRFGLLLKDNKIYSLSPDGQIGKGCKGEGTLCESSLYEP